MSKLSILLILFVVVGCSDPQTPYWKDVCVKSHTATRMMPTYIGKTMFMLPQPYEICDNYQRSCMIPLNWEGEPKCPIDNKND